MNRKHHAELVCDFSVATVEVPGQGEGIDVFDRYFEQLGISDARELIRLAYIKPVSSDVLLLIVRTNFITFEAQNALLKVVEEPPVTTKFVFVTPPDCTLLTTLRSRFTQQEITTSTVSRNEDFEQFVDSGYAERVTGIETALKQKNTVWQRNIKQGLIGYLKQTTDLSKESLSGLEFVARTLLTRGASNKMLLEHAALLLPTRS